MSLRGFAKSWALGVTRVTRRGGGQVLLLHEEPRPYVEVWQMLWSGGCVDGRLVWDSKVRRWGEEYEKVEGGGGQGWKGTIFD